MSIITFTGFETGDFGEATQTTGSGTTLTIQNTVARNNGLALRVNITSGSTQSYATFGGFNSSGAPAVLSSAISTSYHRFYFRYATNGGSTQHSIFEVGSVTTNKLFLTLTSAGNLRLLDNLQSTINTGTTVLSSNTWYCIELKVGTSAGSAPYTLKINGVIELDGTASNLGTNGCDRISLGRKTVNPAAALNCYFDDYIMSDSGFIGAGNCVLLKPNGVGFYNTNWIPFPSGTLYSCTDDFPHNSDTDYNSISIATGSFTLDLDNIIDVDIINAAASIGYIRCTTANSGTVNLRLRSNTTDNDIAITNATTYALKGKLYINDPATSSVWNQSGINAAQVGFTTASITDEVRVTACGLMVDYVPVIFPLPYRPPNILVRR